MNNTFRLLFASALLFGTLNYVHAQWIAANTGLPVSAVTSLAVSGTTLIAGTSGAGAFISVDAGAHWSPTTTGLTTGYINALVVKGSQIFAGTSDGVFLSTNSGVSWTEVNTGLTNTHTNALFVQGIYLYAGTSGGIYRTANGGTSWSPMNTGLPDAGNGPPAIQAISGNGIYLFAATSNSLFSAYEFRSDWTWSTSNLNWESVNGILPLAGQENVVFAGTKNGMYATIPYENTWTNVNVVSNGNSNPSIVSLASVGPYLCAGVAGATGILISPDNGKNWTADSSGLTEHLRTLTYAALNSTMFIGTDGGVWKRPILELASLFPPAVPILDHPSYGSWTVPVNTFLGWQPVSAAVTYRVQVIVDSDILPMIIDRSGVTTTNITLNGLQSHTSYRWRVNASNASGTGNWSQYSYFTTVQATPVIPIPIAPPVGSFDVSLNPTFRWGSVRNADLYGLQLCQNPEFLNPLNFKWDSLTSRTLTDLLLNTTYYWRVNATNSAGTSQWSPAQSFKTIAGAAEITGKIVYDNAAKTSISGATVSLDPATGTSLAGSTGSDGAFTFSNVPAGVYTLRASKAGAWAGANATDAFQIVRAFAGLAVLDTLQAMAADVNNSGSANATDAFLIVQRWAGKDTAFARGDWVFEPVPFTVDTTSMIGRIIKGLSVGDVNKSN